MIGREKADSLRIDEGRYGCGGLSNMKCPGRSEMREFWLEIGIDPETRSPERGSYCVGNRTTTPSLA